MKRMIIALAVLTSAAIVVGASWTFAQQGATPDRGAEVENLGTLPFAATETVMLRPEEKSSVRRLEDKHITELRALEDKYAADLLTLRRKQAEERDALRKTFKR